VLKGQVQKGAAYWVESSKGPMSLLVATVNALLLKPAVASAALGLADR